MHYILTTLLFLALSGCGHEKSTQTPTQAENDSATQPNTEQTINKNPPTDTTDTTDTTNPNADTNTTTPEAIMPKAYQKMLNTGMDVDWLKTTQGREASSRSHAAGINVPEIFKKRGLSHVRMRIRDDILSDSTLLQETKDLVDDAIEAGLIPIIAYQAAAFKDNPTDDAVLAHVKAWWVKMAETFKGYPYVLSYDLIIETTKELKKHNDRLNLLYKEVAVAIRQIDPKRILIVAPNKISNPMELDKLEVPKPTDFMMVEWHFYAAGPKKDNPKKQWTTGTDFEKKLITDKIDYAYNWSQEHNIPTWVGAWMANNYNEVNVGAILSDGAPGGGAYSVDEQKVFARFVHDKLREKDIPFAVNSDTKFFNRETNEWYDSMKEVLDIMIER